MESPERHVFPRLSPSFASLGRGGEQELTISTIRERSGVCQETASLGSVSGHSTSWCDFGQVAETVCVCQRSGLQQKDNNGTFPVGWFEDFIRTSKCKLLTHYFLFLSKECIILLFHYWRTAALSFLENAKNVLRAEISIILGQNGGMGAHHLLQPRDHRLHPPGSP